MKTFTLHLVDPGPVDGNGSSEDEPACRGFNLALSQFSAGHVRVHLVGVLDGVAGEVVTSVLAPLRALSAGRVREAGQEPGPGVVLLDLSGLYHLDDLGLSSLHRAVVGLRSHGWRVWRSEPHGPSLGLLDSAARAGWVPPTLTCTDVLHWQPRAAGTEPGGPCGCL